MSGRQSDEPALHLCIENRTDRRVAARFLPFFCSVFLTLLPSPCGAQEAPIKPVGASVTGWMAELKAGFEKAYRERVVDVYAAGLEEARREYAEQLQLALKEAERAGDKQTAVVFRQESERVAEESWRMPPDDQDTSMAVVRRARQIYREQVSELNRAWDEASRKLVSEFESTLVQGARQLTAKNLEREVRRVLECRRELVAVWLPRMWEVHRGERLSVADGSVKSEGGTGSDPAGKSAGGEPERIGGGREVGA